MTKSSKILIFDIETAPVVTYTWNLFPKYISHDNIIDDWFIICAAWKEVGKDKVHTVKIDTVGDDYNVVKTLRDALAGADVIVGHYIDKFDVKKLNSRLVYHKLPPLPKIPTVDTKKEASKIGAFTSNKLDHLSKHLTGKGKIPVDFGLWLAVMKGSKKALNQMVEYNKMDVIRNETVYLRLRPYMKNHPHKGVMDGEDRNCSCKACGSAKVKKNGIRITAAGLKRQELQCTACGSYTSIAITATVK